MYIVFLLTIKVINKATFPDIRMQETLILLKLHSSSATELAPELVTQPRSKRLEMFSVLHGPLNEMIIWWWVLLRQTSVTWRELVPFQEY